MLLIGVELRGHGPLATFVLPAPEAAGNRDHVGVAELAERLRRECGTNAACAVDDERRVVPGDLAFDLRLEVATGDVQRAGKRTLLVLVGLTDVEQHGARQMAQIVGGGRVDLADLALGLRQELAEAGHTEKPTC